MTIKTPDYVVTYGETPEHLTTGKRYPVLDDLADAELLGIEADTGEGAIVLTTGCAHLLGATWKRGYTFHV